MEHASVVRQVGVRNMAFIGPLGNAFGARWFDQDWNPQLDSPEWHAAVDSIWPHDEM